MLEKTRESVLFYVKLDLALIAATATLLTVLKFERSEAIEFISGIKYVVSVIAFLICLGLVIERRIVFLMEWEPEEKTNKKKKIIHKFLYVQIILHIILFVGLVYFAGYYADDYAYKKRNNEASQAISRRIEDFVKENDRLPISLKELFEQYPELNTEVDQFKISEIIYVPETNKSRDLNTSSKIDSLIDSYSRKFFTLNKKRPQSLEELEKKYPELNDQLKNLAKRKKTTTYYVKFPGWDNKINTDDDPIFYCTLTRQTVIDKK